jgi:divalent metal cation (Fe/Co/Zn/Cd) transporter
VQFRGVKDRLSVTLRCQANEDLPVVEAHDLATLIEERVRRACPDVTSVSVHVEPAAPD